MTYASYVKWGVVKIRDQKKAETSERLIAAAREAFFKLGYADTSMDQLCAQAGVTRGALYHNFGGKVGLFEAVVRQVDEEIGDRLLQVARDDHSIDGFVETCIAYLKIAIEPEVQQIMFRDGPAVLGQRLRQIDQEGSIDPLRGAIHTLQADGVFKTGDALAYAILINGAMIDAALWIAERDHAQRFKAASRTLETLIRGLVC